MTLIIDDSNWQKIVDDTRHLTKGYVPRDYVKEPFGSLGSFGISSWAGDLIPRSDWSAMIKEKKARGQMLSQIVRNAKIPCKNQDWTNFCWVFAVIQAIAALRAANGLPHVELSPASVACMLTGFQNVGGWGTTAIKYISQHGIVPSSMWPDTGIDRRYNTAAAWAAAKAFTATEWTELPPNQFNPLGTVLLTGFPVPIGLPWWEHEVHALDLDEIEPGSFGVWIRNSWWNKVVNGRVVPWGDDGFAFIREERAIAADQFFPRLVTAV